MQGAQVPSLVRELRSHVLQSVAKNKGKKKKDQIEKVELHFQFLLSFIHSFYPEYSMIPYCMSVTFIGDIGYSNTYDKKKQQSLWNLHSTGIDWKC